jgi:acyl-CoA synthetase (AMP-forming)/AMP-acid ligase II
MREKGASVATHLTLSAEKYPHIPALVCGAKVPSFSPLSFSQLDQLVDQASKELLLSKIKSGDKALLFVNPGPGLIIWAFALFRIGAIPVVIDPGMGIRSFLSCIQRTQPEAMVGISKAFWISRLLPRSFKSVRKRYLVRPGQYGGTTGDKMGPEEKPVDPDALAAIVFTSGSTGAPKGVRYLHRTFDTQIQALKNTFGMMPGEIDLTTLPIFGLFNPALGITSVLPEINPRKPASANPEKLVHALTHHKITTAFASPVIGKKIVYASTKNGNSFPDIKRFFLAGAPISPDLAQGLQQVLPNGEVIVPYGATEALPVSSTNASHIRNARESILAGEGSLIGSPLPEVKVRILPSVQSPLPDYEQGNPGLPDGQVGEICVSGGMVSAGYDRMPGATCDARFKIGEDSYHRMGDLGYFDPAGKLRFLGRKAECIHSSKGQIETERCEPFINQLPYVQKCALIGLGYAPNQQPCLVIEPVREKMREHGEAYIRKEILKSCKKRFPEFPIERVFFEKRLPVDARHNAKINRLSLGRKWTQLISRKPDLGKIK